MNKQRIFPGVILVGIGLYLFINGKNILLLQQFYQWPTLLMIAGIAFLIQAYGGKDFELILPGVILFGLGLHFHVVNQLRLDNWPNHVEILILIVATGYLLRYLKVRNGLFPGVLFLLIAVIMLFRNQITSAIPILHTSIDFIWKFWPYIFIVLGCYFLFFKKK